MAPSYSNLNKAARNLFDTSYDVLDMFKFDVNAFKQFGISASGIQNLASGNITSYFETKYIVENSKCCESFPIKVIILAEKWNMNNMTTEATIIDLLPGLTLLTSGTFNYNKHSKIAEVKAEYKNRYVTLNLDTYFKELKPIIHASAVAAYKRCLCGFYVKYNTRENLLKCSKLTINYIAKQFVLTTTLNDKHLIGGSIITKCSDTLDLGMKASWSFKHPSYFISVGSKYKLNKDVLLRAKIINKNKLCLGSEIRIKNGVKLTLANIFINQDFKRVHHKFGIGFEINL